MSDLSGHQVHIFKLFPELDPSVVGGFELLWSLFLEHESLFSPDMFSTNDLKKDHLALLPVLSWKVCISDAMGCISAYGIGNAIINAKSV